MGYKLYEIEECVDNKKRKNKIKKRKIKKLMIIIIIIMIISLIIVMNICMNTKELDNDVLIANNVNEEYSPLDIDEAVIELEDEDLIDMQNLKIEIESYIETNNIDSENISIVIENLDTNEKVEINEEEYFMAASIYKLPLAVIYYDLINEGKIDINEKLQFLAIHQEGSGVLEQNYNIYEYVSIEYLLEIMIKYSDNSSAHILYENLGGWEEFKNMCCNYSDIKYQEEFFSENILTSEYTSEILNYINTNEILYSYLIDDLKNANQGEYLDIGIGSEIAQKYGSYNNALNAIGIVYSNVPYSISIFTELGYEDGREFIGDINQICYARFNSKI